ncbi:chemotaxis protein CheA [Antarcticimicrobium luteum]|uniref:Chemotaxis protein CheA n=1 Tax=Antarcticimicrobium luteum TaxID=2547397 RepID=A0A4R5UV79_9RHOB|nr:chemotaxis protein CheA [Antarcticimicrobium luteum]TDK43123.1 chemotaxis protein CheA [Antarcticimicrobium luteum]
MVQSNKVLTVSYGTFSCTLEGFEDSFDTMKAIAEYFRDLAADDRYFGAEPPQPDTEMLARIAEREVARHVEARREGSGFVLRAAQIGAPAAPAAAAEPVARAAAPAPDVRPDQPPHQEATGADALPTAEAMVQAPETAETAAAAGVTAETAAFMAQAEAHAGDVAATEEEEDRVDLPEAEPVAAATATAPEPDSIAAKLQRIRAVVSRSETAKTEVDYSEDEHFDDSFAATLPEETAEETGAETTAMEDDRSYQETVGEDLADDEEAEPQTAAESLSETARVTTAVTGQGAEDATGETTAERADAAGQMDATAEDAFSGLDPRRAARLRRRMARARQAAEDETAADAEAALQSQSARQEAITQDREEAFAPDADDTDTALFDDLDDDAQDNDDFGDRHRNMLAASSGRGAARRRPRVMILQHDEEDTAAQEPEAEAPVLPSAELPPGTLPAEDEADLMRELAEVEAELRGGAADAKETSEDIRPATAPAARPARHAASDDSSDLSRLMAAASEKLDAPEAASTRETYSHLRAAVAATQAERSAGGGIDTNPDAAAYRDDLARVVQPRRPRPAGARTTRPGADEVRRPAPLKLVAEQRVDDLDARASKSGPVRPRRVAAPVAEQAQTGTGFAAFAEEMGALELPELLEAAAAYMQFVEGRDQFTRPQLIHKAREAADDEFSREDGLRSFGMLLREGKIVKKDSGRFVASGEIGFQPDSRAAG